MIPHPPLETYLRRATRGLWGEQRRLVRAELEGHFRLRVDELCLSGLSPAQAAARALEELGSPEAVGAGMRRVYLLPRLWPPLSILTLLASLLLLWPKTLPAVGAVPWQMDAPGTAPPTLVQLEEVQTELGRQGVQIGRIRIWSVDLVELLLPSGSLFARVVLQDAQEYLLFDDLVLSAAQGKLSFRLSGWANPALQIGRVTLRLRGPVDPYTAYAYLARWGMLGASGGPSLFRSRGSCTHRVRVEDVPGTIYALLLPQDGPDSGVEPDGTVRPALEPRVADVAPVAAGGLLTVHTRRPELVLAGKPGGAVLVRMEGEIKNGQVGYQVVRPARVENLGCTR